MSSLAPNDTSFPPSVDTNAYNSVVEMFDEACHKFADLPAFTNFGQTLTYADIDQKSRDVAAYLQNVLGLKKGDRVASMMPNILGFPIVMFGILRAGLVQVNVNPLYTAHELRHQLNDAGVETIFIFSGVSGTLAEIVADTGVRNTVIVNLGDGSGSNLPSPPAADQFAQHPTLNDVIESGHDLSFTPVPLNQSDLIYLQYTGGTTGLSKGAMLSHGNLVANVMMYDGVAGSVTEEGSEIIITALPLYHIFALMVNCLSYCRYGAHNILITNPRDMPGFVAELAKWKFTAISGVNTLYNGMLHTPGFADLDFSGLKFAWGGGSAIQKAVSDKWKALTGNHIKEGYGLSETSPIVTLNPPLLDEFSETVGLPFPSTEISLRDENGAVVDDGEAGELCVRGPQVMQGYWNNEGATTDVMTDDGYFRTGDVGLKQPNGYFKIVDRIKDMVLVSGFNVYPNEVEAVIAEIPGVVEVAVIGVPDQRTGEALRAFVVIGQDGPTQAEIEEHCHKFLTNYKVPKQIQFIDDLPKSTVGKILRRELRDAS